jgi:hypothetical protein
MLVEGKWVSWTWASLRMAARLEGVEEFGWTACSDTD